MLVFFLLLPLLILSIPPSPSVSFSLPLLPPLLSIDETQQFHLTSYFSGFNLEYSVKSECKDIVDLEIIPPISGLENIYQNNTNFARSIEFNPFNIWKGGNMILGRNLSINSKKNKNEKFEISELISDNHQISYEHLQESQSSSVHWVPPNITRWKFRRNGDEELDGQIFGLDNQNNFYFCLSGFECGGNLSNIEVKNLRSGKNCTEFEFARGYLLFECTSNGVADFKSNNGALANKSDKILIWTLTTNDIEMIGEVPFLDEIEENGRIELVYLRSFGVGNETQNLFVRHSKKVDGEDVLIFFTINNNGVVRNGKRMEKGSFNFTKMNVTDLVVHQNKLYILDLNERLILVKIDNLTDYIENKTKSFDPTDTQLNQLKINISQTMDLSDILSFSPKNTQFSMQKLKLRTMENSKTLLMLGGSKGLYLFDITNWEKFKIIEKYTGIEYEKIFFIEFDSLFVVVQAEVANNTTSIPCTLLYRRSLHRPSDLYFLLPHPSPPPIIEFNQVSSTIILINSSFSYLTLHEVSDPILRITGKNLGSCEIQLEAFSLQPFSGEYRNMLTIFNATVMGKEDVQIFERREEGGRIEEGGGKREEVLTKKSISEREMYKEKMMEKEEEKEDEEVKMEENGRRVYEYIACPGQIKFGLEDYFWGPALEYNFESNLTKNVNESNISPQINKIEKFSINLDFLQKDAIFTRINTNPYFDNEILQFIQISNYTLYIFKCTTESPNVPPVCVQNGTIEGLNAIIMNLTIMNNASDFWLVLNLETERFKLRVHDFYNFSKTIDLPNELLKNISSSVPINEIFQITALGSKLYILQTFSKNVLIWEMEGSVLKVDYHLISSLDIGYYQPLSISVSSYHKDILFILNRMSLIILDISDLHKFSISLVFIISNNLTKNGGFKIVLSKSTLLLVSDLMQIIEEYSIKDYNKIYRRKNYPLYNYTISISKTSSAYSDDGKFFYVSAINEQKENFVLIYNTKTILHNVFYGVVKVDGKEITGINVAGRNVDYLSIISKSLKDFYMISKSPSITINTISMGYSTNNEKEISFKVSVSNQFTDNRYEITFLLTSWNAGVKINSDVRLKENVNDTTNDIKIINQGYNEFSFDPNRFFNGSVISYDLGCLECNKSIILLTPIMFNQTVLNSSNDYRDMVTTENGSAILFKDKLVIYNKTWAEVQTVSYEGYNCSTLVYNRKHSSYLSICFKKALPNLFLFTPSKSLNFNIVLWNINEFKEMKTYDDYLLILQSFSYEENKMVFQSSSIFVYKVDFDEGTADPMQELDAEHFKENELKIISFDVEKLNEEKMRICMIDVKVMGVRVADINLVDLSHRHYFIPLSNLTYKNIILTTVKIISKNSDYFLVSSKNYHTLEFYVHYDEKTTNFTSKNVLVYTRYGFYESTKQIFANEKFVVMNYLLPKDLIGRAEGNNTNKQVLVVYKRTKEGVNPWNSSNEPIIEVSKSFQTAENILLENYSLISGGVILDSDIEIPFIVPSFDDDPIIYIQNPINKKIDCYFLNENLTIIFSGHKKITEKTISLKASNDFSDFSVDFRVLYLEDINQNKFIWIIVVISLLVVIFLILILLVKKFAKKEEEIIIDDEMMDD